jgi:hypothetical protein
MDCLLGWLPCISSSRRHLVRFTDHQFIDGTLVHLPLDGNQINGLNQSAKPSIKQRVRGGKADAVVARPTNPNEGVAGKVRPFPGSSATDRRDC